MVILYLILVVHKYIRTIPFSLNQQENITKKRKSNNIKSVKKIKKEVRKVRCCVIEESAKIDLAGIIYKIYEGKTCF